MESRLTVRGIALAVALSALCGCSTTSSDGSRVKLYESVDALASDSSLVATVSVVSQQQVAAGASTSPYVASSALVTSVASPDTLGKVLGRVSAIREASTIIIRQLGNLSDAEGGEAELPILGVEKTYLLFLTPTGVPGAGKNEFYITGGTAGLYEQVDVASTARGAVAPSFQKLGEEGDTLPETLLLNEVD